MAHRVLAEKYATQLREANNKIFELEAAVADCESRLQSESTKEKPSDTGGATEKDALTKKLNEAQARIHDLETAVEAFEQNYAVAQAERTELRSRTSAAESRVAELNKEQAPRQMENPVSMRINTELQETVKASKTRETALSQRIGVLEVERNSLQLQINAHGNVNRQAADREKADLQQQLEVAKRQIQNLQAAVAGTNAQLATAGSSTSAPAQADPQGSALLKRQLASERSHKSRYLNQVHRLEQQLVLAQDNATNGNNNLAVTANRERVLKAMSNRAKNELTGIKKQLATAEAQAAKEQALASREKKRRYVRTAMSTRADILTVSSGWKPKLCLGRMVSAARNAIRSWSTWGMMNDGVPDNLRDLISNCSA